MSRVSCRRASQLTISGRVGRGSLSIGRLLASGLLVFALFLAPLTFSGSVDASEPHAHASMNHETGPDHEGHGHADHGAAHCGSLACSSSYVAGVAVRYALRATPHLKRPLAGDDPLRRSPFLGFDPPVPRGGFSQV